MQVGSVNLSAALSVGGSVRSVVSAGGMSGLGRAAMIANFCDMIDDWLKLIKKYENKDDMVIPPTPFYTYKRGQNGHFSVQKVAAADIAATMLLAIA